MLPEQAAHRVCAGLAFPGVFLCRIIKDKIKMKKDK